MRDASSDHLDKAPAGYSEKIMGTEVAGDPSSTKNHNEHGQIDINSSELSNVKTSQGKKRWRKKSKQFRIHI